MAASLNKVFLIGNLTREPELRYTPGTNFAVCEFGLAINRHYIQNGQEKDETCFLDIVVWGKQGESCSRFLQKGSSVFVEGRLVFDQWVEKDTQRKRSRIRITAERVQFLNTGRRDDASTRGEYSQTEGGSQSAPPYSRRQNSYAPRDTGSGQTPASAGKDTPQEPPMPEGDPLEDVDDIPF